MAAVAGSGGATYGDGGPYHNYLGASNNFLGVKGLTGSFSWYSNKEEGSNGSGGVVIDLSYTSKDAKNGYYWQQIYSENGGKWTFDNKILTENGIESSGSYAYYSPERLANHINGNTITFYDNPHDPGSNYNCNFILQLYKGNSTVFTISYGYTITNGITTVSYPVAQ